MIFLLSKAIFPELLEVENSKYGRKLEKGLNLGSYGDPEVSEQKSTIQTSFGGRRKYLRDQTRGLNTYVFVFLGKSRHLHN